MRVMINSKSANLPDFLLVGAARSGTTTLYNYFKQHPEIYVGLKEPHFFSLEGKEPSFTETGYLKEKIWELSYYLSLYKEAKDYQKIGDCSPSYLSAYKQSIGYIKKIYGKKYESVKILIILRDPVDALFSRYLHQVKRGKENLSLVEAIKPEIIERRIKKHPQYSYIEPGMYYKQVKAYIENFSHVQIHLFEDQKKPELLLKNIFKFLEVQDITGKMNLKIHANPSGIPKNRFIYKILNSSQIPKFFGRIIPVNIKANLSVIRHNLIKGSLVRPHMDPDVKKELLSIYYDDIKKLELLVRRDLSCWLRKHSHNYLEDIKAD
jgi:hypothetical protein